MLQAAQPANAVQPTPDENQRLAAASLTLGWLHFMRYAALPGPPEDLSELARAIIFLAGLAHNNPHVIPEPLQHVLGAAARADLQADLAYTLLEQVQSTTDPALLSAAILLLTASLAATPNDHPDRPEYLSSLGGAYQMRFDRGGVLADLNQAIEAGEQAVAATSDNHPNRHVYLSNLGSAYLALFDRVEVAADLDRAIEAIRHAMAATPDDHPDRARCLANLGRVYEARLDVNGQGIDREILRALARQVTAAGTASPPYRVRAAEAVGSLAHAAGEHGVAVELLDAAVSMLPSVAPREAGWADQEHRLGEHRGLVGEAVAAHCAINDPVGAVEAAELGRGVLLAAQLDSRSELTDLEQAHPELALAFRGIRDQLNTPPAAGTRSSQSGIDPVGGIEHRKRLWATHDQLLAQIRQQDDFARFLLPPRLADLQPATAGGAAILVG